MARQELGAAFCEVVQAHAFGGTADTAAQRSWHRVGRSQRAAARAAIQHLSLQRYMWGCRLLERLAAEPAASAAIMAAAAASRPMPWDLLASTPLLTSIVIHASQAAHLTAGEAAAAPAVLGRLRTLRVTHIAGEEAMNVIRLLGGTTQLTELLLETSPKLEGGLELRRRNTPSARPSTGAPLGRLPVLRKLRIVGHLAGLLEAFVAPAGAAGQLTALHLEQGVIWEPDLAQLAACSGLQQLVLKGPTRLQQHGQAALLTGGMAPLTALTTLALQSCCLAAVPGDMFGLSRLRQLSLRDNVRINAIPAAISSLQQLQLLDISHTGVRRLPAHLGTWLPHMEALLLEGLAVQQLPLGLQRLTRLEARGSGIRDVDAIHRLVNLKQLALSGVDLYTPATQLTLLTALETLWLEFNSTRRWMDKQQQTKSAAAQVVVPEPMPRLRSLTLSIAASSSSSSMDNAPLCDDEFIAAAHMMVHGLPGVVGAQQLTYLSLQGCFEQGQWRALGQLGVLPRLQQLKLRGRQGILGLAAPWLQQQPQLTYLELEDCLVEAAHMQQLPAQLEALHLPTCTGSPTQPTALAQLVGVRKLRVTISSQLPLWLLSLQRLEELEIVRSAQHAVGNMPAGSWQVLQQLPLLRRVWVPHGEEEEACMPGMYQQAPHLCWYHQD